MMMTMCLIFCCACANVSDDEPVVFGAGAVVAVGTTAIAAGACWVGGGIGDAAGAGFADPVPRLQANKTRIEIIQIAPLKIFIAALSLLYF
jgi:class 3 adenylate cyclase